MTTAVREALRDRVARAAVGAFGECSMLEWRPLAGGHSGITHVARLLLGDDDGELELVVRAAPEGRRPVGRHDVLRQARIIRALGACSDVPVPAVLLSDSAEPPYFATGLVPGVASDPILDSPRPHESAELIAAAWDAAIELLARLHRVPLRTLALRSEPAREPGDEVDVWARTMRAAQLDDDRAAVALEAALRRSAPARARTAIVHGDYRLGNILMEGATPRALIDWEIWSVGDPAVDVGWLVQFTDPATYPGVGREVPGTPGFDEVIERYAAAAGRDPAELEWFVALGCFKLAAIQAHNRRRHLDGEHHDDFQELLGPSIVTLLERGLTRVNGG
jgi:aminoglycoside phosphotransferase (APT) family kinase protein